MKFKCRVNAEGKNMFLFDWIRFPPRGRYYADDHYAVDSNFFEMLTSRCLLPGQFSSVVVVR